MASVLDGGTIGGLDRAFPSCLKKGEAVGVKLMDTPLVPKTYLVNERGEIDFSKGFAYSFEWVKKEKLLIWDSQRHMANGR